MRISEKRGGNFQPHPDTEGSSIKAVCVDVTPSKLVQTEWGDKKKFKLVFETEVLDDNDNRYCVWSRSYTESLNEKAAFRKDVKKMFGRDLTTTELADFDCECLIGMGAKLIIEHEIGKDGNTYANISFIAPDKDKDKLTISGKYIRVQDREERPADGKPAAKSATADTGSWQDVVIHIGKNKGNKLGDVEDADVQALIDHWLPKAQQAGNPPDSQLVAALLDVKELIESNAEGISF